jgi:hypothetical protein
MVPLPPAPQGQATPVPPIIDTTSSQAGASFGRRGSRQPPTNDQASVSNISAVSINGQSYHGAVFDTNGTRIG